MSPKGTVKVRLLFVDDGSYHHEEIRVARSALDGHERLIDGLREDPQILRQLYVDVDRLCGAWVADDD